MRDHPNVLHLGLVEDGRIDVRVELHPRAPPLVTRVYPDLQDPDAARGLGPHHLARLGRAGHPVQPPPPGVVREPGVRSTAGDPETGRHQVAGPADLAHPLRLPNLEGDLLEVAAGGDDRADAVVGVAVQMVDEVLAGEVAGAPARVPLPAEMRVGVDERRHHRAPGQVDDCRLRRRRHLGGAADPHDQIVADQERGLLDDAAVPTITRPPVNNWTGGVETAGSRGWASAPPAMPAMSASTTSPTARRRVLLLPVGRVIGMASGSGVTRRPRAGRAGTTSGRAAR